MTISLFDFKGLLIHHWPPPWQTLMDSYLNHLWNRSQSKDTMASFVCQLTLFFNCKDGPLKYPWQYSRQDVEAFIAAPSRLNGHEVKPSARNSRWSVLSSFYSFASKYTVSGDDGRAHRLYTETPPTAGIVMAKVARTYRQFTESELRCFFAALPPRDTPRGALYYALFQFYLYSCRRRSELVRLRWGDIVPAVFDGGRQGWTYRWTGKGKAGQYATAELPSHIYEAILNYLRLSRRLDSMQPDSWVFFALGPEQGGGGHLNYTGHLTGLAVWSMLKKTCKVAGLDPSRFTTHSFRHTGSRIRYEVNGHNALEVMHHLDHHSLVMTQHYLDSLITPVEDKTAAALYARYADL